MEKMQQKRNEMREKTLQLKQQKMEREQLIREGKAPLQDYDFDRLIDAARIHSALPHTSSSSERKLTVIVRKRPLSSSEIESGEIDSISCCNPIIRVHEEKYKVDGLTKYVENHDFQFDNTFAEHETTEELYKFSIANVLAGIFNSTAVLTCFAYGQTGSGKTFTMKGM